MARFKTQATAQINFETNTKDLQNFYKKLKEETSKVSISDNLKKDMKVLQIEMEQVLKEAGKMKPEDITPDIATEFLKKYNNITKTVDKLNEKVRKEAAVSTTSQIEELEKKLKTLSNEIAKESKEIEQAQSKFSREYEDGDLQFADTRAGKSEETSVLKSFAKKEEILNNMRGASGKLIDDFRRMKDNADEITESFTETESIKKKIEALVEKGLNGQQIAAKLNKKERKELEETVALHHKNFTVETAMEQVVISKKLEAQKALHLRQVDAKLAEDINALQIKEEQALKLKTQREQENLRIKKEGTEEQQKLLQLGETLFEISQKISTGTTTSLTEIKGAVQEATRSKKEFNEETKKSEGTLLKAGRQVFSYGVAFTFLRRVYRETLRTIRDLDSALTEMAIVTSMNRQEAWELTGAMQQLARETGFTTTEIAKLSTVYFRQGRTLREVVELTRVAAQAARVAGISAAESADYLTSAVNAFQLSADQALDVSDKFAALAASSASSYEELAVGLSKFAAQANVAGVSIDFAMGLLSKGIETTREAPETIGTALKTVIARMRELTDLGKTFEDGMDISRVETALRQVGVALRDEQGQFRNLELVLTEIGQKWDTLNTNQQASIAVALAGTRQQSRLIAVMQNFDRTLELVDIAQESAGATMAQHTQFMRGMEAASVGLQNAYQKFITTITESEFIIGIIRGLSRVIEGLATGLEAIGFAGQTSMIILTSLFIVMRFGKTIMAVMSKLTGIQISLQGKKNILDGIQIGNETLLNRLRTIRNFLESKGLITMIKKIKLYGIKNALMWKAISIHLKLTKAMGVLAKGMGVLKVATLFAGKGFLFLTKTMLLNPIGWLIAGVALLVKGYMDLKNGNDTLAAGFASSFKVIFEAVGNLIKTLMSLGGSFVSLTSVLKPLINLYLIPSQLLLTGISIILNLLTVLINKLVLRMRRFIGASKDGTREVGLLGKALEKLAELVGAVTSLFSRWMENSAAAAEESNRQVRILTKTYQELAQSIADARREGQAENFELLQKNRNLQELIDEYEELQRLRSIGLFGQNELERERDLLRELENLDPELISVDFVTGVINQEETMRILQKDIDENSEAIAENLFDMAVNALDLAEKNINRFLRNEGGGLEDIQNYLIHSLSKELTQEQARALRSFYAEEIAKIGEDFSFEDLINLRDSALVERSVQSLTSAIDDFNKALDKNEDGLVGMMNSFYEIIETIEDDAQPAFRELYVDLVEMFSLFENKSPEAQKSIERVLDAIGRTPEEINLLASTLDRAGISLENFLDTTASLTDSIMEANESMSESEAAAQAIIYVAGTLEDAAAAAALYSIAIGKSLLEVTQAADHLSSRMENLRNVQEQFFSGDLSDQDFLSFIEQYADLFGDQDFFNAFTNGLDLSNFLIKESIQTAEQYRVQLITVKQQLHSIENGTIDATEEQINYLRSMEKGLTLLTQYNGALRGLTNSQIAANNALKAYQLISRMGFDTIEAQGRVVETLTRNIGSSLKLTEQEIEGTRASIRRILTEAGSTLDADDIYEIVDGVVHLKDAYTNLEPSVKQLLDTQFEFYEQGLEQIYTLFETIMSETLRLEESTATERIKVYEDYFAALDRLEDKRNRKVQREDLVTQLARLEGATDERSRRRALELRRELNQLDEDTSKNSIEESRKSLLESISDSVEKTRKLFQDIFTDWIASGETTAENLYRFLQNANLVDEKGWADIKAEFFISDDEIEFEPLEISEEDRLLLQGQIDAWTNLLEDPDLPEGERNRLQQQITIAEDQLKVLENIRELLGWEESSTGEQMEAYFRAQSEAGWGQLGAGAESTGEQMEAYFRAQSETGMGSIGATSDSGYIEAFRLYSNARHMLGDSEWNIEKDEIWNEILRKKGLSYILPPFKKGGMVDYTGLAMLHGSSSSPEAVLSAKQTEMFIGLRDALQGISLEGSGSSSIQIDNISISTASLNNNQDFKRAGESLADAFKNAIQRRGITVNTNRN